MFKNKTIQMKLVKTNTLEDDKTINNYNHYETPKSKNVVVSLAALYAVKVAVDTSSKIALHIATK